MNARLLSVCVLVALALLVAACGSGGTATPSPASADATATLAAAATPVPAAATATATLAPSATATTAASAAVPPTATATVTVAPPTATAVPAAATVAPTLAVTKALESSSASSTINGQGISYNYPSGWRLNQETKDRYSVVTLEGPDGALLTLTMYGADMEPAQLSATLLETMKKQFSGATVTPLKGSAGGIDAEGYRLTFTYMGVPMTSTILSFRGGKSSFTLYTQATDASLGAVQPGFDLIKNTLVVK